MNDRYHQISEPAWKTILKMLPNLLSFCLGATFNVLSSPSNLKQWHVAFKMVALSLRV